MEEIFMPAYALANFFIYAVINAFTPGPGNILALNTVTNYGWKKGKRLFFGIFAGYYVVQIICAIFVFGVGAFLPKALNVMKYIGAAYILWLAMTWIGLGLLIQKFYLKHYRIINIILALTLLECIWSILRH